MQSVKKYLQAVLCKFASDLSKNTAFDLVPELKILPFNRPRWLLLIILPFNREPGLKILPIFWPQTKDTDYTHVIHNVSGITVRTGIFFLVATILIILPLL
jgi:hypothetical protein